MSKLSVLTAGAIGYVLGARAGRERYEQIATHAQRIWSSPPVQQVAQNAQDMAREKAPVVQGKLGEAAKSATSSVAGSVASRFTGDSSSSSDKDSGTPETVVVTAVPSAAPDYSVHEEQRTPPQPS